MTTRFGNGQAITVAAIAFIVLATATLFGTEQPTPKQPTPEQPTPEQPTLERNFQEPPHSARPWVYWFWINGNISKKGITADLESFKRGGIGGVLWMEVSGPWWAPDGDIVPLSPEWHEAFQWAVSECARLGIQFDVTLDFGYGSGGPHITPELSIQKLVWSEQEVEGGQAIDMMLNKPHFGAASAKSFPPGTANDVVLKKGRIQKKTSAWLQPGVTGRFLLPVLVATSRQARPWRPRRTPTEDPSSVPRHSHLDAAGKIIRSCSKQ